MKMNYAHKYVNYVVLEHKVPLETFYMLGSFNFLLSISFINGKSNFFIEILDELGLSG
jgi:hypothetical protein